VVGVPQYDTGIERLELLLGHGLDRALRAHRHEYGRFNLRPGRPEHARARPRLRTGPHDLEGESPGCVVCHIYYRFSRQ